MFFKSTFLPALALGMTLSLAAPVAAVSQVTADVSSVRFKLPNVMELVLELFLHLMAI